MPSLGLVLLPTVKNQMTKRMRPCSTLSFIAEESLPESVFHRQLMQSFQFGGKTRFSTSHESLAAYIQSL